MDKAGTKKNTRIFHIARSPPHLTNHTYLTSLFIPQSVAAAAACGRRSGSTSSNGVVRPLVRVVRPLVRSYGGSRRAAA